MNLSKVADSKLEKYRQHVEKLEQSLARSSHAPVQKAAEGEVGEHHTTLPIIALSNYALRDTNTHRSDIISLEDYDIATVYIHNETDQDLTCQIYGCEAPDPHTAVKIGPELTVAAGTTGAYNISVYSEGWLPFSFVAFKASTAPTKGYVHIRYLRRVG